MTAAVPLLLQLGSSFGIQALVVGGRYQGICHGLTTSEAARQRCVMKTMHNPFLPGMPPYRIALSILCGDHQLAVTALYCAP
jgi:hypothetical protein